MGEIIMGARPRIPEVAAVGEHRQGGSEGKRRRKGLRERRAEAAACPRREEDARVDRGLIIASRVLAVVALAALVTYHRQADAVLATAWAWLREQWWFRHDSWEPVLSTTSFQVYLLLWRVIDKSEIWARWRIQKASPETPWVDAWERATNEGFWYLAPLLVIDYFFPRRILPAESVSALTVLYQVTGSILLYDFFFFFGHKLLHSSPWLFRTLHSRHHTHTSTRACETIRHNIADGTYDVICSIAGIRIMGSHPISRSVHNIVLIWLITELHAGYDAPWMLHNIVPFGLWGGVPRHDYHHQFGHHYYGKFLPVLDKLFGDEAPKGKEPLSLAQKLGL